MAKLGKREIYEGFGAFLCLKRKRHKAGQEPSEIEQDKRTYGFDLPDWVVKDGYGVYASKFA